MSDRDPFDFNHLLPFLFATCLRLQLGLPLRLRLGLGLRRRLLPMPLHVPQAVPSKVISSSSAIGLVTKDGILKHGNQQPCTKMFASTYHPGLLTNTAAESVL